MSPQTLSEKKHLAILEAAEAEFRVRGLQGTSMDRIAERATVSKRTVYNHFPSKDDLFRAIIERIWNQAQAATQQPFREDVPIEQQLQDIAKAEIDFLAQEGLLDLVRALFAAAIQAPEIVGTILKQLDERDLAIVTWVRSAREHGALSECDPKLAGEQFHSLIKGSAFWPQLLSGRAPLNEEEARKVIESTTRVFIAAYGPLHEASPTAR